ncbi:MAG TPA: amidohydrolase family protein [Casimicrobiaceae bacterium]|jgi:imidazolonepropionase-like amidohydrolase
MAVTQYARLFFCAALATLTGCADLAWSRASADFAVVGATVVHPERDKEAAIQSNATIVVAGNRIVAVGATSSTPVPPGTMIIDGHGKWIVPGLVDGHVHFFQSGNLYTRPDVADFTKWIPYPKEVVRNQARLSATFKVWLASGVTSVVDIGGPLWNFEMRDTALQTKAAPRVAVAGPLLSMIPDPKLDLGDPPIIEIRSIEAARDLVQRELLRKPDYIKVWFIHRADQDLAAEEAIIRAAGDAAHRAGVALAVHATELNVAKAALRAGADYLVHSVQDVAVDDEFIALAKKNHALYCPTLFVLPGYQYALSNTWRPTAAESRLADPQIIAAMGDLARMPADAIPAGVARRMAEPGSIAASEVMLRNLRTVANAGIPIVMGTDAGNIGTLHGPSVFREMALMQQAGMTPLEVLRSATVNGAKAMRRDAELGTIAPGRLADFVVLDADPTASVDNLSRVYRVVKDGTVYDPDELIRSIQ